MFHVKNVKSSADNFNILNFIQYQPVQLGQARLVNFDISTVLPTVLDISILEE